MFDKVCMNALLFILILQWKYETYWYANIFNLYSICYIFKRFVTKKIVIILYIIPTYK